MADLSPRQREVYEAMEPDVWYAARDLKTSVVTLNELKRKKLIVRKIDFELGKLQLDPGKYTRYKRRST